MNPTEATHLSYVERLLGGALGNDGTSEFSYITRSEGKPGFWELVAFRVPGLGRAAVGALHFLSQNDDPLAFARRSLAHYLTSPPQPITTEGSSYPAEVLDLRVPREDQSLPELLGALKRGEETLSFRVPKERVEAAVDFRSRNPSLQRSSSETGPTQRVIVRTASGHVVRATATNFAVALRRTGSFLALTGGDQLLPGGGWMPLPTLVVHRDFLIAFSELPAEGGVSPAAFSPETAAAGHVLDPRINGGPS